MSEISKASSMVGFDTGVCDCNKRACIRTSWTAKNPGRQFQTCGQKDGCNFFMWMDEGLTDRAKEVFNELSEKKNMAEEKLKLAEERFKVAEEKLKLAEEKLKLVEKKLAKKAMKNKKSKREKQDSWIKNFILIVLFVMVVVLLNNNVVAFTDKKYLL